MKFKVMTIAGTLVLAGAPRPWRMVALRESSRNAWMPWARWGM